MPVIRKSPVRRRRSTLPLPGPLDMPIDSRAWDRRAIVAGILATLIFHLVFFVAMPHSLVVPDPSDSSESELGKDLPIELMEEEETQEQPKQPRYVETNPEAPENIPDKTTDFSARNQQAANEKAPEELSKDKTPAREGQDDVPVDKAFAGTYDQTPTFRPSPATREQQPMPGQPGSEQPMAQNPPSGFDETRSDDPDGLASSIAKPAPNPKPDTKPAEGTDKPQQQARPQIDASVASPARPAPAPRPRLPKASPGPVKRQPAGVSQVGRIGINANFGPFGDYLERMQEAISQRWDALGRQRSISESQTRVVLEFTLTRQGLIRDLETVDTTSQALGTLLCRTAVEQGQSYGEWSKEMVALLGEDEKITFTFYYW